MPVLENRGDNARAASAVQNGDDQKWVFIWSIGDQEITHEFEPQRTGGEIGSLEPLMREWNQCSDGTEELHNHPVGGIKIVFRDVFPNVVEIA